MEERHIYLIIIGVLSAVIVSVLISGSNAKDELRQEIFSLSSSIKQKDIQIAQLSSELKDAKDLASKLSSDNTALSSENKKAVDAFNKLRSEAGLVENELSDFEEKLKASLEWFGLNSNIENVNDLSPLSSDLKHSCVDTENDVCSIKLSCLNFVNNEKNKLSYKPDNETVEGLQGLQEMYEHKGGDCEDYSLLAVAELNFLKGYCARKEVNETVFYGYERKEGGKHFVEFSKEYYLDDAEDYAFYLPYYYAVCGTFQKNRWELYGHCLLGFSEAPLSKGVYESLSRALLVEPQTGEVKYDLRRENSLVVPKDGPFEGSGVYLAFDSGDLYIFDSFNGKFRWMSYSEIAGRISSLRKKLGELVV